MDRDYLVAMQNLTDSSKKVGKIHTSVAEILGEMRGKSMDFYYKLALLSGGVLSLSITYLGYLASIPNHQLNFAELLFLSWFLLLLALFSSIYRNHFNLDMGHYQVTNTLNEAFLEQYKATLAVLESYPQQFINLKTKAEVQQQIDTTKKNISTVEKAMKEVKAKEDWHSSLWVLSQKTAHISFFLGIVLITIFASLNLPISINFTIFEMFRK